MALAAMYRGRHVLPADGVFDAALRLGDAESVARQRVAFPRDVEEVAAAGALGEHAARAAHILEDGLGLRGDAVDHRDVTARDLESERRADAGRQHRGPRLYRHRP